MSVEVNVVGTRCGAAAGGLSCLYCYERLVPRKAPELDVEAVKATLRRVVGSSHGRGFSLFGGEPLLAPLEDLEALWRFGWETYRHNGVQTSGRPITEAHFALFKKYRVNVSFSIDGPGELNDHRWAGSVEKTREATAASCAWLLRCLREKVGTGLIVTLHRANASPERLPRLLAWLTELDAAGLQHAGLHLMEHDGNVRRLGLSPRENADAMLAIYRHQTRALRTLKLGPFRDVLALLRGQDAWKWNDGSQGGVGCTWGPCDPYTTTAVEGVDPDGKRTLCPRVHKDGVEWGPAAPGPLARPLVLRDTPQEQGGCKGCRHLITCKGHCPGTATGGDWRKRSRDCETWRAILEAFEQHLLDVGETPVTLRPDRDAIEARMAEFWAAGRAVKLVEVLAGARAPVSTGDHDDHQDHDDYQDHDDLALAQLAGGEEVRA